MSSERRRILLLCFFYCAIHMVAYVMVIFPWFSYRGYRLLLPDPTIIAIASVILLAPALFLPIENKKLSDLAPWVLYACLYVPGVYVPLLTVDREPFDILSLSCIHLVGLICFELLRNVNVNFKFNTTSNSSWLPRYVLPTFAILVSLYFWQKVEFRVDLSWATLYDRRLAARDLVGGGALIGYINQLYIKVLIPALALFAWLWKSKKLALIAVFCILMSWNFDANKLVLFTPMLIIGVLALHGAKHPIRAFLITLTLLIILFIPLRMLFPSATGVAAEMAEASIKRALYEPGLLTGYYWDHFTTYPLNNFGGSPLSAFFTSSPYESSIAQRIGYMYFGNEEETANAGILASAIADVGLIGVPIICALAGFTLRVFQSLGEQRNRSLAFAFIIVIAQDWSNRAFQTSLITGGVLASGILLWAYSDPKDDQAMVAEGSSEPSPQTP